MQRFLVLLSLPLALAACGGNPANEGLGAPSDGSIGSGGSGGAADAGGADAAADAGGTPTLCTSQAHWTNGDRGSQLMHPGGTCLTCHAMNRSAPKYVLAGTVYPSSHEQNDCNGVNGTGKVTLVVTDANGNELAPIPVNNVGNFYYAGTIASPFHVKIVSGGRENAMMASPPTGDCNSCHTQDGANDAPGRILPPPP